MMAHNGLAKLAEELGECSQIVGKLLAYPDGNHPDGNGGLHSRLEDEIADVIAASWFVANKLRLTADRIDDRAASKLNLFHQWDKELK